MKLDGLEEAGMLPVVWATARSPMNVNLFLCYLKRRRMVLGLTRPRVKWVPWDPSPGLRWPGLEVDHLYPSSVDVKNEWNYTPNFPICLHFLRSDRFTWTM